MSEIPSTDNLGSAESICKTIESLANTIDVRSAADAEISYTAKLLAKGTKIVAQKLVEESGELAIALVSEGDKEVAEEASDLIYHLLVAIRSRGIPLDAVADTLQRRQNMSGLAEKASRSSS
ncbi:MAG: phosphoribosyl-ATP diphosphatase [Pseudomonadota bacterium]